MAKTPAQHSSSGGGQLYYEIANFQLGMDLRKSQLTAPAGTLRMLQNAHVTSGGEIEKRPAFTPWCVAPAYSIGLCAVNSQVYTHLVDGGGGEIVPPTDTHVGVIHIDGPRAAIKITGSIFSASEFDVSSLTSPGGGSLVVGASVTGPDVTYGTTIVAFGTGTGGPGTYYVTPVQDSHPTGANETSTFTGYISGTTLTATSRPVGGALNVGAVIAGSDVQAGTVVTALTGTPGVFTVNISQTANNVTGAYITFTLSGAVYGEVAFMQVDAVSGGTPAVGMPVIGTGVSPGTIITGLPPGGGPTGLYTVNIPQTSFPSGLVGPPTGATLTSQVDYDTFNGQVYALLAGSDGHVYHYYNGVQVVQGTGKAANIRTYKEKMYGVTGRYLFFSAVGDPTVWEQASPDSNGTIENNHSGFINLGAQDADSEDMITMEVYYDKMALFSTLSSQLWFLDPDESKNQYYQTLRDAGTIAPASVRQYVANDVYFLGNHGIRSLRARDLTMTAAVADVGSPMDPVIQDLLAIRGEVWGMWQTMTLLDPRTGRIWMTAGDRIYVLSNYASPNISAWSVYLTDNFFIDVQGAVAADPYIVLRDYYTGTLYRFGSTGSQVYDSCPVEVLTPFLSFDKPASFKFYQGFDAVCSANPGSMWSVQASFAPDAAVTPYDQICLIDNPTVEEGRIPISGRGTHIQLKLTHQAPGPATLSKLFVHYAPSDTA